MPFHDDGWRDGEHLRAWMTGRFRDELTATGRTWLPLPAHYSDRLRTAIAVCDALIAQGWQLADPLPQRNQPA